MKSEDEVSKTNNNNAHKVTNIKQIKNTNKRQNKITLQQIPMKSK